MSQPRNPPRNRRRTLPVRLPRHPRNRQVLRQPHNQLLCRQCCQLRCPLYNLRCNPVCRQPWSRLPTRPFHQPMYLHGSPQHNRPRLRHCHLQWILHLYPRDSRQHRRVHFLQWSRPCLRLHHLQWILRLHPRDFRRHRRVHILQWSRQLHFRASLRLRKNRRFRPRLTRLNCHRFLPLSLRLLHLLMSGSRSIQQCTPMHML
mmetsp:Transcript_13403/g.20255  ORF Transcript_13403/g.20255 Transcript_13403/m.20255 type:complete len:203 (-) Transcript_13403:147-755(-)